MEYLSTSPLHYGDTPNSLFSDLVQYLHDDNENINFEDVIAPSNPSGDDVFSDKIENFTIVQQQSPDVGTVCPSHPIASTENGNGDSLPGDIGEQKLEMTCPSDPVDDIFDRLLIEGKKFDSFMDNSMDYLQEAITENVEEINVEHMKTDDDSAMPLTTWTPEPIPFTCDSCQVLRQILHSNGTETTRLEIHGIVGVIYHGVLEIYDVNGIPTVQREMVDFCAQSMEDVKQYLVQYCQEKNEAGFVLLQDPLESFYSTLHVGINLKENLNSSDFFRQKLQTGIGVTKGSESAKGNGNQYSRRSSLSAQRERTGKLTINDLVGYFHLPIEVAGKRLAICPTVIKKVCRRYQLSRWPYRKIQSYSTKISKLEERLERKSGLERREDEEKIESLKQQRDKFLNDIIRVVIK